MLLLTRGYPQAGNILLEHLADTSDPACQVAICQAIVQSGIARREFVKPLTAMLTTKDPTVRSAAAEAMIVHKKFGGLESMIKLLVNRKTNRDVRLTIISTLQRTLEKKAVGALVSITDDPDESVRRAACRALSELTGIRTFDEDSHRWKSWWARNKHKSHEVWLVELAGNLTGRNLALRNENLELRRRLAATLKELFGTTPPAGRDAMLVEMLKDPITEVRLAGIKLARRYINRGAKPSKTLRKAIQARIDDPDSRIRPIAAVLLASTAGKDAVGVLISRLKVEKSPHVRKAIYEGLMLAGDTSKDTWNQLLSGLSKDSATVSAAAAGALVKFIEKGNLTDRQRLQLRTELVRRYHQCIGKGGDSVHLREALLGVIGALKDEKLIDIVISSLKDPAATVRLSGVRAMKKLALAKYISSVIPLVKDPDRGVRLVAIATVGALGRSTHIETVLERTNKQVEPDADVRREAWRVTMKLLKQSDLAELDRIAEKLSHRTKDRNHLIDVLKVWADKIPADEPARWIPVRLRLAEELISANRPAEAAGELALIHAAMLKTADSRADDIWLKWITAMLAADDPSAIIHIEKARNTRLFNQAVIAIRKRLLHLEASGDLAGAVRLAEATLEKLAKKLSDDEKKALTDILTRTKAKLKSVNYRKVAALLPKLTSTDNRTRQAAITELKAMGNESVPLLIEHLQRLITSQTPDPTVEKAIINALSSLAPHLKGYDIKAPLADKLKILKQWLGQLGS